MKNSGFLLQCTKPRGQNSQVCVYKLQRIPKDQSKMDNPEKPTTQGTQDEDKQTKQNTTQYMLDTTMRKQTYFDLHNDDI